MDLWTVLLAVIAAAIILGCLRKFGPRIGIDGTLLEIIWWIVVVVVVIWLLNVFGVIDAFKRIPMPRM